ncbi:MAG: aryl-sulfate sulfotransferase [Breznakibacter sp.]|nr:aryl-sulfate sulfotransferase [Breznakibacter sp.]
MIISALKQRHLLYSILALALIAVSLTGCDEKSDDEPSKVPPELIGYIQSGNLLKTVTSDDEFYNFTFEEGTIQLPREEIASIEPNGAEWVTTVYFKDGRFFLVPTLGDNLTGSVRKVTLDPSGYCPLAVEFHLSFPVAGRVKAIVKGKKSNAGDIEHFFEQNSANQVITILGLYSDYKNNIEIIFTDNQGNERRRMSYEITTAPLNYLHQLKIRAKKTVPQQMVEGLTLISFLGSNELDTDTPFMIDAEGEIRWLLALKGHKELGNIQTHTGLSRLKNGNFLCADIKTSRIIELDMLANVVKTWELRPLGYRFHHEVTVLPNDNFLVLVDDDHSINSNGITTDEDVIVEVDHETGQIRNKWDLKKSLDENREDLVDPADWTQVDWAHSNGIVYSPDDDCIIVSCRYQGIIKLDRNNNVKWILSPHKGWDNKGLSGKLLQPLDKDGNFINDDAVKNGIIRHADFDWSWGGHNPSLLPDGSLLMFDNGYYRQYSGNNLSDFRNPANHSRSVIYEIDENKLTVRQKWQYGEERKRECWAVAVSSTQYLASKNHVLFCPGVGTINTDGFGGKVIEINKETKEVVYELELSSPTIMIFHRATRIPLYPETTSYQTP